MFICYFCFNMFDSFVFCFNHHFLRAAIFQLKINTVKPSVMEWGHQQHTKHFPADSVFIFNALCFCSLALELLLTVWLHHTTAWRCESAGLLTGEAAVRTLGTPEHCWPHRGREDLRPPAGHSQRGPGHLCGSGVARHRRWLVTLHLSGRWRWC